MDKQKRGDVQLKSYLENDPLPRILGEYRAIRDSPGYILELLRNDANGVERTRRVS